MLFDGSEYATFKQIKDAGGKSSTKSFWLHFRYKIIIFKKLRSWEMLYFTSKN